MYSVINIDGRILGLYNILLFIVVVCLFYMMLFILVYISFFIYIFYDMFL